MKKFKKILLIDDDSITNYINSTLIRNAEITSIVKIATNGAEAIDYLKTECKSENSYPDLIIVDINMPVMDGFEFLREYEKLKIKEKPIIRILSTSTAPRDIKITKEFGVAILNKPLTSKMLEKIILEKKNNIKMLLDIIKTLPMLLTSMCFLKLNNQLYYAKINKAY